MIISEASYKGITALKLDNGKYSALFIPQQGSKLCSLVSDENNREFIYQGKTSQYRLAYYGSGYLEGECAGIDEAFPNIDEYFYDAQPWKGILLPDHGEVWSLPWKYEVEDDGVAFSVDGVNLPYSLKKKVKWNDQNCLRMEYTLINNSDFDMDYIWASHMMIAAEKGCKFRFPEQLSKSYTTMSDTKTIGGYGDTFYYPKGTSSMGVSYDMSVYRGESSNDYQKWYFADKVPGIVGWGEVVYPDDRIFRIEFPTDSVPYLGAIQAEGGTLDIKCMFMEPCSGAWDRPDIAKMHKMNSVVKKREIKEWYLNIILK